MPAHFAESIASLNSELVEVAIDSQNGSDSLAIGIDGVSMNPLAARRAGVSDVFWPDVAPVVPRIEHMMI